jgi:ABC-type glycerol-3-phosphate transport system permease component
MNPELIRLDPVSSKRLGVRQRKAKRNNMAIFGAYVVIIGVCCFTTLPFVWMFLSSLKPLPEIFSGGFLPTSPSLNNYVRLFGETKVLNSTWNSIYIALISSALSVFLCALGGYAFAKFCFKGKEFLFGLMLATMAIPFVVTMVPLFIMMRNVFQWIDTPLPLIVPSAANAFGIFFMRQYMISVADEMLDAGRIDGASEFKIFTHLVLPTTTPALVSLGIIFFMASWNAYLFPLIVLRNENALTLPLMLGSLTSTDGRTPYDLWMACSVVSIIPAIVVFLSLQRYFYAGITAGSVKG